MRWLRHVQARVILLLILGKTDYRFRTDLGPITENRLIVSQISDVISLKISQMRNIQKTIRFLNNHSTDSAMSNPKGYI